MHFSRDETWVAPPLDVSPRCLRTRASSIPWKNRVDDSQNHRRESTSKAENQFHSKAGAFYLKPLPTRHKLHNLTAWILQ